MKENVKKGQLFVELNILNRRLIQCEHMARFVQLQVLYSEIENIDKTWKFFISNTNEDLSTKLWDVEARGWGDVSHGYEKFHTLYMKLGNDSDITKRSLIERFKEDERMINDPKDKANDDKRYILYVLVYRPLSILPTLTSMLDFSEDKRGEKLPGFLLSEMIHNYARLHAMAEQTKNMSEVSGVTALTLVLENNSNRAMRFYIGFTGQRKTGIAYYLWSTSPKGQFWSRVKAAYFKSHTYFALLTADGMTEKDILRWARNNGHGDRLLNGPTTKGNIKTSGLIYILVYTPLQIPKMVKALWVNNPKNIEINDSDSESYESSESDDNSESSQSSMEVEPTGRYKTEFQKEHRFMSVANHPELRIHLESRFENFIYRLVYPAGISK